MIGQVLAGKDGDASVGVVAVEAILRGAVSHPVLHNREHAGAVAPGIAVLEALHVRLDERLGDRRVLPKGAVDAAPPRFGREIGLRRKRHVDTDGAILLARDVGEAPNERRVAEGGEAERLGPLGELPGLRARADHVLEMIPRIGADRDRNPQPRPSRRLPAVGSAARRRSAGGPPSRVMKLFTPTSRITLPVASTSYSCPTPTIPIGPPLRAVPCIIAPAFSSSDMRATRSRARSSSLRRQSSYGSSCPLRSRSLNLSPSTTRTGTVRAPRVGCA